ncbi:hypothetical protein [Bacillus mesophilum]|uniref:DUF4129 domain-containing protein n=1 Tax=Bacillus mesophilum TaxID=1071718 RepID=A0A7V7RPK2_9BACI|nr:hypothetical protein [Bacillus mesophilum]KAB2335221.1 hypothetical protein F7732_01235 [Bacillus mesophilum]
MKSSLLNHFILLLTEILFGSMLICVYYTLANDYFSLGLLLLILVPAAFLYLWLSEQYSDKGNNLFFIIVLPYILLTGILFGFPVILLIGLSLLLFWRSAVAIRNKDSEQTGYWLLMTFVIGGVLLFVAQLETTANSSQIVSIIILQMAVFLIGGFIRRLLPAETEQQEKKQFTKYFFYIIGSITLITALLTAGMNVIKWLFYLLLEGVAAIGGLLAAPLFMWSEGKEADVELQGLPEDTTQDLQNDIIFDAAEESAREPFDPTILFYILFIGACILLFYFVIKKSKSQLVAHSAENAAFSMTTSADEKEPKGKIQWNTSAPDHVIRKEIYQFEKYAGKLHLGRNDYEAIGEWFQRIGITDSRELISIYEKVRYGDQLGTPKEYKVFKEYITKKKAEMKKIHKQLEKEGKIPSNSIKNKVFSKFLSKKKH